MDVFDDMVYFNNLMSSHAKQRWLTLPSKLLLFNLFYFIAFYLYFFYILHFLLSKTKMFHC